ncbi:MAG: HPP family protein [Elusimicrobiota bacterium]
MKNVFDIRAAQIMKKPVETVRLLDSVHDVAHLFNENHIGAAAVVDQKGKPVGVITKTDIVRYLEEKDESRIINKKKYSPKKGKGEIPGFHEIDNEESVQDWMTPVIFSAQPETPLNEIAKQMVKNGLHHIFVQGKKDGILGIISSFDILSQLSSK